MIHFNTPPQQDNFRKCYDTYIAKGGQREDFALMVHQDNEKSITYVFARGTGERVNFLLQRVAYTKSNIFRIEKIKQKVRETTNRMQDIPRRPIFAHVERD